MKMQIKINKGILIKLSFGICILIFTMVFFSSMYKDIRNLQYKDIRQVLQEINELCNGVYDDVDGSEIKYKELVEAEEEPLKKGAYASAMIQVNAIKGDYDGIIKYKNIAIENYMKVPDGELLAIAEDKYVAWIMFKVGKYSESLKSANKLSEILNKEGDNILNEDEILDTQALIHSIYINIYSEFGLKEEAKFYYDKLCEIEVDDTLEKSRGDKIAYSKMLYATKIEDYELVKRYAYEMYDVTLRSGRANANIYAELLLINCAYANLHLGITDGVLEQIDKSKAIAIRNGDEYAIADVYETYAMYYNITGDKYKALDYYNKAIQVCKELENDFLLIRLLDEYINFCEENKINNNVEENYKLYYKLTKDNIIDETFKEVLDEAIDYKEQLNIELKEKAIIKNKRTRSSNIFWVIILIILVLLILRMKYLFDVKKESESALEVSINKDYLTKVNTRKYGYHLISKLIYKKEDFTLGIIDIDNFKNINDTYGHLFGDFVLKSIGGKLIQTIGEKHIILRYGGEEFVVVFINMRKEESKILLDKARKAVQEIKFEEKVSVSFSAGIVEWNNESIDNTIKDADKLLYKAKKAGKNRIYL